MYVESVPNRNSPPAVLLRESFRQNGRVKKRTLANLSCWRPVRVEALRRALRGEFDQLPATPVCGPVFGLLFALKQLADELGLTAALGRTRAAKLALFLVLARLAHQGSRLSAVRWAADQAVAEVLGLGAFDEDDLYAALDDLSARQVKIEQALYRHYLERRGAPPSLLLYDVTSSYFEGLHNALGEYGYNRDGKRGKKQIVIGLLADDQGEPLAVRVFAGNRNDPTTVPDQIRIVKEQFGVEELVFVGDRGMVKSKGKQALGEAGLRYITALTDPQIRRRLSEGVLQLELFAEQVCEVEADGVRYVLRLNESEAKRQRQRLEDKLAKLGGKLDRTSSGLFPLRLSPPESHNPMPLPTLRARGRTAPAQALAGASQADRIGPVALAGTYAGRRAPAGGDRASAGVGGLLRGRDRCRLRAHERPKSARPLREPAAGGARLSAAEDGLARGAADLRAQRKPHPRTCVVQHAGVEAEPRIGTADTSGVWHDRRRPARDHLAGRAGGVGATVSIGISSG